MTEIRVAHVVQSLNVGGLERVVQLLAEGGRPRGIDAMVVAYLEDGPIHDELRQAGIRVHMLGPRSGLRPSLPLRLTRLLLRERVDVVHTHHLGPLLYGGAAARMRGLPVVHTEHSHEFYDKPRRRTLGSIMMQASSVVAVAQEIAEHHASMFGFRPQVIRNGVRTSPRPSDAARLRSRASLGLSALDQTIGCVARLSPEKDHDTLIQGFALVAKQNPSARLVLIGDGPERRNLEELTRDLGLSGRVIFTGSRSDVESLLPALDVFALTSLREGLPMALLEAMQQGIPAVTTDVGGMPKLLEGGGGIVVPVGEVWAVSRAIMTFFESPKNLEEAGAAARRTVLRSYSAEQTIEQYVSLYRSVARADTVHPAPASAVAC